MKTLNYFLLLIGFGLIFTSCGDDDDLSSSDLVGTWLVVHEKYSERNGSKTYEYEYSYPDNIDWESSDVGGYARFDKNGNYSFRYGETGDFESVGRWELKGDKIVATFLVDDDEYVTVESKILKLTSTEFIMETHVIENNYEYHSIQTLQKVK